MNILAIGAHFDDVELGCGGTLAKHVAAGDNVQVLVVSHSGYATPDGIEVRNADKAREEGQRAAAVLGVSLHCLGLPTLGIGNDETLTSLLLKAVQEWKADTVYTHWTGDVHRDHAHVAHASLMAARHVPRLLMYRSNWYTGEKPFHGTVYTDITLFFERKLEALACHASEMSRVGQAWHEHCHRQCRGDGIVVGVDYAECFACVRWLQC